MIKRFTAFRRNLAERGTHNEFQMNMLNIHGHPEYGTEIFWHDAATPAEWLEKVAEWEARKAVLE